MQIHSEPALPLVKLAPSLYSHRTVLFVRHMPVACFHWPFERVILLLHHFLRAVPNGIAGISVAEDHVADVLKGWCRESRISSGLGASGKVAAL